MVAVAAGVSAPTTWFAHGENPAIVTLYFLVFFLVGWVIGVRVRRGQLRAEHLRSEAATAREEAAEAVARAIADERARIACELHDAVGHAVNVMVMQAGALRISTADPRSASSLREIERVGRAALTDLDRMLGLLGAEGGPAPLEPAHGVADIRALVDGMRTAGVTVRYENRCNGALDDSSERPIGAAAYRIVQEALTNALKHAAPATVDVAVSCDDSELVVSVVDDGRGAAAGADATERVGRGLAGMNERVAVLGGRIRTGPVPGGGFRVEAHLPRSKEHA
jgi:signal transduction histidine kinase